jgi:hypothetical protein
MAILSIGIFLLALVQAALQVEDPVRPAGNATLNEHNSNSRKVIFLRIWLGLRSFIQ